MTITADYATYGSAGTGGGANAVSYTTVSQTPVNGDRVLVAVGAAVTSGTSNTPTVTGNGQTWTLLGVSTIGVTKLSVFTTVVASASAGTCLIDFAGQTQQRCVYSFGGFRSSLGSPITLGTLATGGSSTAATAGSITVVNPGGGDGVWAAIYAGGAATTFTKDANYTVGDNVAAGTEAGRLCTQYLINSVSDLTADWTWATAAGWFTAGVVLLEPGGAPVAQPDVIVGGAKKPVVAQSVVVGGAKKPVVNKWVIVAGVKKPVV